MFPIDIANLPHLRTRQALLVVDFQNDFVGDDGVLSVEAPEGLLGRVAGLSESFRQRGDVIWIRSEFDTGRVPGSEQIVTSDSPPVIKSDNSTRGRRRASAAHDPEEEMKSPEAFLTPSADKPECVRPGSSGSEFPPAIKAVVKEKDKVLVKSHYSVFKSDHILQLLRARLITELFICGSLTNVGVYATSLDAARFGYEITIVEDCCGYRSSIRHHNAIRQLTSLTGCQVLTAQNLIETLPVKSSEKVSDNKSVTDGPRSGAAASNTKASPRHQTSSKQTDSFPSGLQESLEKLSLGGETAAGKITPRLATRKPEPSSGSKQIEVANDVDATALKLASLDVRGDNEHPEAPLESPDDSRTSATARSWGTGMGKKSHGSPRKLAEESREPKRETGTPTKNTSDIAEMQVSTNSVSPKPTQTTKTQPNNATPNQLSSEDTRADSKTHPSPEKPGKAELVAAEGKIRMGGSSESDPLCEGDTKVIYHVLPETLAQGIFGRVRDEVQWQRMSHQGGEVPRLVAVQGDIRTDGSMPIYRHPSDESPPLLPFSTTILEIKAEIEKHLGHQLNHVLIQLYRDGNDYISEHSDKTLDIAKGSFIANVSLGAERTMTLRTKRKLKARGQDKDKTEDKEAADSQGAKRKVEKARLPHNSLCKMGLTTNMRWLHGIRQDKRQDGEKAEAELAYDGSRISLTFRLIGTFLDRNGKLIWGQGAVGKTREDAQKVVSGQTSEAVKMVQAFGRENQSTEFDWDENYGSGFNVLHITAAPRLFTSSDAVVNQRIQIMLAEYGINYAKGSMSPLSNWKDGKPASDDSAISADLPIKFVDIDPERSQVQGELAILLYLDRVYGPKAKEPSSGAHYSKTFTRFQQALGLLARWREAKNISHIRCELAAWDSHAAEAEYIAAETMSLADFALWPVLHDIAESNDGKLGESKNLQGYYDKVKDSEAVRKALGLALVKIEPESTPSRDTVKPSAGALGAP